MTRGKLILCGTPIGNLEDASPRLLKTLGAADHLACEDTRRTRKLLTHFGITPRHLIVYNEGNERRQARALVKLIAQGETVALVSDAGMPGLSDPGFRLVRSCIEEGLDVEVVPGPTAAVTALVLSGLLTGRFAFEGFLPRKTTERKRHLSWLVDDPRTLVFYASPHRIEQTLADLAEVLGPRRAVLARELTKLHEEVRRGRLEELAAGVRSDPPRGEIVLVVEGAVGDHRAEVPPEELARRARALMEEGVERREALSRVAKETGVPRRRVFDALLENRN
jgi:16S rRNA (cytidine1402-2'-O)-methyltransferase